ncbi:Tn3 family transposase, partial [Escherichia coli]
RRLRFSGPKTSIICSPMTSLKTSIKTITYLSDTGCLEIQGASLKALRVIGRIERTLFMLDWFRDPALRRRVQAGLNKGEARNALARAVFMHRLGEIRDRKPENQSYRASGLTLLTAAISLWNTVYMERAVDGTVAKLAMRQPFVLFKGLTFQKLCLPGAFRPG